MDANANVGTNAKANALTTPRVVQQLSINMVSGELKIGRVHFFYVELYHNYLGPVVQSTISLTSSLVVKMLTVLVSTIFNSHVFLPKKCEKLLQKLLTFFSTKILAYLPYFMIKVLTIP